MEVMEDGNLMDKVHILIQRDMEYYKEKQSVLQESICPGIVGGRLDFPRSASFAAMKLVLWWEEEFVAAYRKKSGFLGPQNRNNGNDQDTGGEPEGTAGGIIKTSDPLNFVEVLLKSGEEFLEHLHVLTQEALDHADLTVLTGTIGASALLKNCLWFYIQSIDESKKGGNQVESQLQTIYKKYQAMGEALAERLLDLHCRLLSLYILQEPDSLDWENKKPFCESERGSYVIQMWWLYMKGTREDLWNTVPPKMAQRVFEGMLNESLTILTVRYTQTCPSEARSQLLQVDISNLLLCVAQLLPSICDNGEELIGLNLNTKSKILRDIHTKCQELLHCFVLRGVPLDVLYKVFRKGIDNVALFKSKSQGPCSWIIFSLPNVFNKVPLPKNITDLPNGDLTIAVELLVLMAQPQPNWSQLLKVLKMTNFRVLKQILEISLDKYKQENQNLDPAIKGCDAFLCPSDGTCRNVASTLNQVLNQNHYYELIQSCSTVLLASGNSDDYIDFLQMLSKDPKWAKCFNRTNVWNQIRPPWFESLLLLVKPVLPTVTTTVINAVKTGASMYQAMQIILGCFSQLWDVLPQSLTIVSNLVQDILPGDETPLGHSALIQILISALYSSLLNYKLEANNDSVDDEQNIALAVAECLCSIDEDNKHTDQIEELLDQVRVTMEFFDEASVELPCDKTSLEVQVSDILMTNHGKKSLKTLYYFIKSNNEWFHQKLGVSELQPELDDPNRINPPNCTLLHTMFHIGYRPFDQFLTGAWRPDWINLLQRPMGLSVERVWSQVSLRYEFRDVNSTNLTSRDVQIISALTNLLKQS